VSRTGDTLVVAMDDPTQSHVVDTLQRSTDLHIEVATSTSAAIGRALTRLYREEVRPRLSHGENVDLRIPTPPAAGQEDASAHSDTADEIVRKLLRIAIDRGASDIHLETIDHRLHVRFRIDGNLQNFNLGSLVDDLGRQRNEVISRIKILSKLDIAERRRPQDGSFRGRVQGDGRVFPMDFRVSIIPGYHGENAVIRILDPRRAPESVDGLGLSPAITTGLRRLSRSAAGMLLVTGPTGSGKSTTLFGMLKTVSRPEIKIITAEDPIEYVCEEFCQHEVNDRAGNTFARYVRAFLRHDPEVIMIGEIRDSETAELAFRAAQTGHLVLSTLHTNDALSAITRLKDLGIDHSRCVSSLLGVVAQRLIRAICWNCKEEYTPPAALVRELFDEPPKSLRWYRGAGCPACHLSGYKGRIAIAELWELSEDDVMAISSGASVDEIRRSAAKSTIPMTDDVVAALREGRINLEDLVRSLPQKTMRDLRTLPL
jgi:type IV pilus assembly protein PilB